MLHLIFVFKFAALTVADQDFLEREGQIFENFVDLF